MLKLNFVSNERMCCCYCEHPGRAFGYLPTVAFTTTIEDAKKGMLEELKILRDEIDDLIKKESENNVRFNPLI